MRIIINQNEKAFLFRNGLYIRMLTPGRHNIRTFLGETYVRASVNKAVEIPNTDIAVLLEDKAFTAATVIIDVPDGHLGVKFEDGRIAGVLTSGRHCYFTCYRKITCTLFDTAQAEITGLSAEQIARLPDFCYSKITVSEGETGILFYDDRFVRALSAGVYYFWNTKRSVVCEKIDMRAQQLDVDGQEILTADKVSLRINFVCSYKIKDALRIAGEIKNYKAQIYTLTQLALRRHIGAYRFDELLEQRESISDELLMHLRGKQEEIYVEFLSAGIKDIILPGEIRDIMNTVLVAEKNAQANVIARREEVASTRSLLNTAKLLDENATLYKLKELEYMEKICDKVGSISVGGGSLLTELQKIVGVSR